MWTLHKKILPKRQNAFMLVEVMIAVIILSVCLVTIVQSILGVVRATAQIGYYRKAIELGQNYFYHLAESKATLDFEDSQKDESSFQIRLEDRQLPLAANLQGLMAKSVVIQWVQGQNTKQVEFQTYQWSVPVNAVQP